MGQALVLASLKNTACTPHTCQVGIETPPPLTDGENEPDKGNVPYPWTM